MDALEKSYENVHLKDCIGTGDAVQDRKEKMLLALTEKGATIIDSNL